MSEKHKLQYLIELIDDSTEEVRTEVLKELNKYGTSLEQDLLSYSDILNTERMNLLQPVINSIRQKWLINTWESWQNLNDYYDRIESVLSIIAKYQYGIHNKYDLTRILDFITEDFMNRTPYGDELDLAYFLFKEKGISGSKEDYYNPLNSNAVYAIKEKKGLPITLSLIFILIGNRLGYKVFGCNFPGHFLAKVDLDDEIILVDCFNNGKIIYEEEFNSLLNNSHESVRKIIYDDIHPDVIIKRILNNLVTAYSYANDSQNHKLFSDLNNNTPYKSL